MIRTRNEWYAYCDKHGTSGDIVYDILNDWKESDKVCVDTVFHEGNVIRNKLDEISDNIVEIFEKNLRELC